MGLENGHDASELSELKHGDHVCESCHGAGRVADPMPYEGPRKQANLDRGWRRRWLIIEMAKGNMIDAEFMNIFGCSRPALASFRRKYEGEIASTVKMIEDKFVLLWIADKMNRLAELQQDVDDVNEVIEALLNNDRLMSPLNEEAPKWIALKERALRAVAEELGQIPNKVQMALEGTVVTYRLDGVNMSTLLGDDLEDVPAG